MDLRDRKPEQGGSLMMENIQTYLYIFFHLGTVMNS